MKKKTSKGIKIKSGYILNGIIENEIQKTECFIAEKDGFFAHGNTIKSAISDLNFKIISEKLKNEPIKKDTVFTVDYYRAVTGACDLGCRKWMDINNLEYEIVNGRTKEINPIKAEELIPMLVKSNAYGIEKIKQLIDFKL